MALGLSIELLVGYLVEPEHKANVSWGSVVERLQLFHISLDNSPTFRSIQKRTDFTFVTVGKNLKTTVCG